MRARRRDVLEVRRRAANQATEADDAPTLAGFGDALRRHRNLERAGHPQHFDVGVGDAGARAALPARRSSSRSVTKSLKRATTMAMRIANLPCQTALRFSRNAFVPSCMSSVRGDRAEERRLEVLACGQRHVEPLVHGLDDVARRRSAPSTASVCAIFFASAISSAAGTTRLTRPIS